MSNFQEIQKTTLRSIGVFVAIFQAACATGSNLNAERPPQQIYLQKQPVVNSLKDAVTTWGTLLPATGALIFASTKADGALLAWAHREKPLFSDNNKNLSRSLRNSLMLSIPLTAIAANHFPNDDLQLNQQATRYFFEGLAIVGNSQATSVIKNVIKRRRTPDVLAAETHPSLTAAETFMAASLSTRNLSDTALNRQVRLSLKGLIWLTSSASVWSQIEQAHHYPSDLLFSAAIGHFVGSFFYEWGMTPFLSQAPNLGFFVSPKSSGAKISVSY